ncbi:MAG: hypothetical protein ACERKD_01850 [Prolixibacteraceae bacterium]
MQEFHTSDEKWFEKSIKAYTLKQEFNIIDDLKIGLTKSDVKSAVALISFVKKQQKMPWKKITQTLTSIGITSVGVWIIAAAIADPEPTSKLTLLITGGLILTLTGSLGTLAALGLKFSVTARRGGTEFNIRPE